MSRIPPKYLSHPAPSVGFFLGISFVLEHTLMERSEKSFLCFGEGSLNTLEGYRSKDLKPPKENSKSKLTLL